MDVKWPDRRADVLTALDVLAAGSTQVDAAGSDMRWPDLTNAIHWLVDDTWWDKIDPAESIGTLLHSTAEANAIRSVVTAVMAVAERQGTDSADSLWFGDPAWPTVQALAREAARIMRT